MSLTLDATLQAALDGSFHKPIVKIVSTSSQADIPFDGNLFNLGSVTESDTNFNALSTGQLALTFVQGNDLRFIVSNAERTSWSDVLLYDGDGPGNHVQDAAFAELASGNLGVIFITLASTTYRIFRMVITPSGSVVTAATEIQNTTKVIDSPALCELSTGGFLLVYKYYDSAGPTYSLYKRTSDATFVTWSAADAITLSGTVDGQEKNHPALLSAASGRIYLFYDYVDDVEDDKIQANVYHVYSSDNGATWSAPSAITSYTGFSVSAVHPSAAEREDNGDIVFAFHERRSVISIGTDTSGWSQDTATSNGYYLHYDPASGKLFIINGYSSTGTKVLGGIVVVDTTTWTIEKCYTQSGTPGWNSLWAESNVAVDLSMVHADGQIVVVSTVEAGQGILVLDHSTETVREYFFETSELWGFTGNVSAEWESSSIHGYASLQAVWVDADANRVYVLFCAAADGREVKIGYFDLTEAADPITGKYEFHNFIYDDSFSINSFPANGMSLKIYPDDDRVVISCCTGIGDYPGYLAVYSFSTGTRIKYYLNSTNEGFHLLGALDPVLISNKIYCSILYTANYGQEERRGLMIVDLVSDTVTYERPTYATIDSYNFKRLRPIENGGRIIMATAYGVVFYDVTAHTWTLYDSSNVPGFENAPGDSSVLSVAYDEVNDYVFAMGSGGTGLNYNMMSFVEAGLFFLGKYIIGTLSGSDYSFGSIDELTLYSGVQDLSVVYDENDILWATWSMFDYSKSEQSIQWDRDAFSPDLSSYIVAGSPVKITHEIGKTSTLEFTLARGDLFDTTNLLSIYAPVVSKGRTIELWMGEKVAGVDYWQSQGKRVVSGTSIDFRSTDHPTIAVTCEDPSVWWPEMVVTATPAYSNTTFANVFAGLMAIAQLESDDYDIPTLSNSHNIYMQWVDESFQTIMDDLCHHFGCFGYWQSSGKYTLRPINLAASVSHTYSNRDKLIDWTADDRYGSFINRVTVRCEGHDFLEVLWDEERVASKNGTVGFWSKDERFDVWFSDDRTRRCRYCRMVKLQSVKDYSPYVSLLGGGGSEEITYIDPDELYVTTEVEVPDRAMYAFAFASTFVGFSALAIACDSYLTKAGWCYIPIMGMSMSLGALIQVLTAVANYRYDYYARPLGHEKQMYQATADDIAFQQQLGGKVIAHEMDDALSYTVEHCRMVAEHEIDVLSGQRNRVAFKKIAHLQDEIGDVIRVVHPVSGQSVDVFVARIQRVFNCPSAGGAGGEFSDSIDGWRVL